MNRQFTPGTKADSRHELGLLAPIFRALIYSGSFVAVMAVLLVPALTWNWVKADLMAPVFLYGNYFAVILGSVIAGHLKKGKGWLTGLIFAAIYLLLSAIIAPVWNIPGVTANIIFIRLLILFFLGSLGGMIGVNL